MKRGLKIAVIEDDPGLRELLQEELESEGFVVHAFECVEDFQRQRAQHAISLVISDIRLPGQSGLDLLQQLQQEPQPLPFILITAFGTVDQAVQALQQGADDFITKPLDLEHLLVSVKRVLEYHQLRSEVEHYRRARASEQRGPGGIIGASRVMRQLFQEIEQIAPGDGSVLVLGESGTGKELVARALHQGSQRAEQAFIAVNCAGIPAELMESEFFGHSAGAFTGAQKARAGLLQEASGGTLLLDEMGEMPLALQAKLLRVLQEGTMRPVGSDREVEVDVRIIAATHQNLEAKVKAGEFREDLFYRLETFAIQVPPLRQRGDDVMLLADYFLAQLQAQQEKPIEGFSPAAVATLTSYRFPGNVRELQNAIERAYTFCSDGAIEPEHLPARMHESHAQEVEQLTSNSSHWPSLQAVQEDYVRQVLAHTEGNKQQAAKILGVTRRTLYRWLDSLEPALRDD